MVRACTVVTVAQLPVAAVLARSYLRHHPDHQFVTVVVDRLDEPPERRDGSLVVGADWIRGDLDEYLRLATAFGRTGLAEAVKPRALCRLLTDTDTDVAVFLDPDIWVRHPFADTTLAARDHGLVLVPRTLLPLPRDGREPSEAAALKDGSLYRGYLAVGRQGVGFLDFWAEQALYATTPGQPSPNWFDRIPALFTHLISRDPRLGAGYWNLHEPGRAADPLFVAFRGYEPARPWMLTRHVVGRPRVVLSEQAEVRALCAAYDAELTSAQEDTEASPYGFDRMGDGTRITVAMRAAYHAAWMRQEDLPAHPFGPDAGAQFREWLSSPESPPEAGAGLNRLVLQVWADDPSLALRFPQPVYADAAAFRTWCRSGAARRLVPAWARPQDPADPEPPRDTFGVNVVGTLTAEHGLGEMGRIVHRVVEAAGIPLRSVVETAWMAKRSRLGLDAPASVGPPIYPVTILAMNGNVTELALASHPEIGHQRYLIGVWAWELAEFPASMRAGLEHVDEVWALSEFTRTAIAPHAAVPVKTFPTPVHCPPIEDRPVRGPGDPVRFLFSFDFNSTGGRKNPWGVVVAFQQAFGDRQDARLVIKAINGHRHVRAREQLRHVIGSDPRIEVLEAFLSPDELDALYRDSNAYISLHRGEGFGLTVAEAMARGLAVIATDYSSTTEFLDARFGWPVPFTLVEVGPGWLPYEPDATWADPDLAAAARAMREIADDSAEARRRGLAARTHLQQTRSIEAAAAWVDTELRRAYQKWQHGGTAPATAAPDPAPRALLGRAEGAARRLRRAPRRPDLR